MKLSEYRKTVKTPLRQATLLLLLKDNQVLLAMKKRGFGVGKWNGVGGKPNPGEDILATAIREAQEEIGVTPFHPKHVASLDFYFPLVPQDKKWNQQVFVFTAAKWKGKPTESEEMKPQWFAKDAIPYKEMWVDDELWLPKVLAGSLIKASFMFGEGDTLLDSQLHKVGTL